MRGYAFRGISRSNRGVWTPPARGYGHAVMERATFAEVFIDPPLAERMPREMD